MCNAYEVIWLAGNHDGELKPDLAYYCNKYTLEGINFNHKAEIKIINEFSGHYHPKATVSLFKKKISRPCFLIGESKIILPAYGAYTGGIDSKNNIFKEIFKNEYKVYLLLNNTVVKVIENVL